MANTPVRIWCFPGTTTAWLLADGGSGTPNPAGYAVTQDVGFWHLITVPEALVGEFIAHAGDESIGSMGITTGLVLADTEDTVRPDAKRDELIDNLTAMITGSDSSAAFTETALENVPTVDANIVSVQGTAVTGPDDLNIELVSPVTENGTRYELTKGDDYTGARAIRLDLSGDDDLTGKSLVFEATYGDETILFVFAIEGTDESDQYADLAFPGKKTRDWTSGREYDLKIKIRHEAGKDQTVTEGVLYVKP